jgi:hypothetical protein
MNNLCASFCGRAVFAGLALAASIGMSRAQTFLTGTYTNNFDVGTNKADFSGSGSVASWLYWYGTPGGDTPMTNEVSMDVNNNTNSGSLQVVSPFLGVPNSQNVFFGTFGNQGGYDGSVRANLLQYQSIKFWIRMAPGTPPRMSGGTNADFGTIGVGIFTAGFGYQEIGRPAIPLAASNAWVQLIVPIDYTQPNLENVPGIAFNINSYSTGYPQFNMTNYIDSLELFLCFECNEHISPVLSAPQKAISGLNCIATVAGNAAIDYRYQVATVADTGYTFVGRPSVTYSWTIKSFPTGTGGNFQQHFFIVNGSPGIYDQPADYNLADCLFMTVQQSDAGTATFSFRYKTNEPFGNAMLFNTASPTDTVNNPYGWPVMPYATLSTTNGALGTWSVTFTGNTNITVTAPDNSSTNFNIDPAVAALFADPVTLILGAQPNNTNGAGKAVVYSSFSASGCASPFSDNFLVDTTLNRALWNNFSSDTNGLYLVQPTAAFWVPWTLPDGGFSLQVKADNNSAGGWIQPNVPVIRVTGKNQALVDSNQLPSPTQGYFQMVAYQFTRLQVLLAGETNAPDTPTGKTGLPTPVGGGNSPDGAGVSVTINAVDPTFHIVPGVTDSVTFSSSADPNTTEPPPAPLVNGSLTEEVFINATGNFTVMATDTMDTNIAAGTSSSVTITP